MQLALKNFRGLSKPASVPKIDYTKLPRGQQVVLPLSDPSFYNIGPTNFYQANRGTGIQFAPCAFGQGALFNSTTSNNSLGFQVNNTTSVSMEFLFITGSSVIGQGLGTFNASPLGTSATQDKGVFFSNVTNTLSFYCFTSTNGTVFIVDGVTTYKANTLYHVVATCDTVGNMRLYTNGILVASSNNNGGSYAGYSPPYFVLGSFNQASNGVLPSNVNMLYVGLSNTAWSATEVEARYNDPFNFLTYPEDDIFVGMVGGIYLGATMTSFRRRMGQPGQVMRGQSGYGGQLNENGEN